MTTKDFCAKVGQRMDLPRDLIHRVLTGCIDYGKEIMAEGDEWRLPGLGKFYCNVLPPGRHLDRFKLAQGEEVYHDLPKRKRVRFKFAPYTSANTEINQRDTLLEPEDDPNSRALPGVRTSR